MPALYSYSAQKTWCHRLDPRTKLVFLLCYLVLAFVLPTPLVVGSIPWPTPFVMFALMVLLVWFGARVSPRSYLPFLFYLTPIIVGIVVAHTFFLNECPCLARDAFILRSGSTAGFLFGTAVAFRIAAMAICFIFFSFTTDPFEWALSMYKAGLPYKGAFVFASGLRFFPLLQQEFITVQHALEARGSDLLARWYNPLKLIRGVVATAIPVGLGGLRRSRTIALSMELRGFSFPEETGVERQTYRDIRLRRADWVIIATWTALTIAVVALRMTGRWSAGPLIL